MLFRSMVELNSVGARYMNPHLKNIVLLWINIQTLLIENNGVPALSETVDEDNQPKKVFDDYKEFITNFTKIVNS